MQLINHLLKPKKMPKGVGVGVGISTDKYIIRTKTRDFNDCLSLKEAK